jgi:hypothetical protein
MRPFLTNPTKRVLSASASAVVSLASVCSISLLAGAAVTLTSLISAREASAAAKPEPLAVRGEIVLWVPPGTTSARVAQIAESANCVVVHNLAPPSQYYLLRLKGVSPTRSVKRGNLKTMKGFGKTRAVINNVVQSDEDVVLPVAEVPSAQMLAAVESIKTSQPDALANPNFVHEAQLQEVSTSQGVTPNDTFWPEHWDKRMINMPPAWRFQNGSRPVIVANIDTGFDVGHPDFFRNGVPMYIDPINTQDLDVNGNPSNLFLESLDGHGMHTAGTIAAVTNNGEGVSGVAGYDEYGVNIKLLPIKASFIGLLVINGQSFEFPLFNDAALITAINQSVSRGASVINMSLRSFGYSSVQAQAVASAIRAGVVVVAGAGNDAENGLGDGTQFPTYPADYPGVIKVTAVNSQRQLTSYSNFGGRVTIAAPGGQYDSSANRADTLILSTVPRENIPFNPALLPNGQLNRAPGYGYLAGTSMASPQVAGAAALLMAAGASAAEVPGILAETATPLPNPSVFNQSNGEPISSASAYGAGLLNVGRALLPRVRLLGGESIGTSDSLGSSASDLGDTYFRFVAPEVSIGGVGNLIREIGTGGSGSLTYRIERATDPTTPVQAVALAPSSIPGPGPGESPFVTKAFPNPVASIRLGQDRYKAVLTLNYRGITTTQTQFFQVLDYRQTSGLSLFSVPFRPAATVAPEQQVLTLNSGFALFRRDPLNILGPSNEGYYRYQPNEEPAAGNDQSIARFTTRLTHTQDPLHTNRSLVPLSYAAGNPAVSLAPIGVGYWLNMSEAKVLETNGVPATGPVAIPLFGVEDDQGEFRPGSDGWNMIGGPFPYPVNWSAVSIRQQTPVGIREYSLQEAVAAEIINAQLVGWDVGTRSYFYSVAPAGQLLPFRGYWVRALKDCTLVVPPSRSAPSLVSRAADVKARAAQTEGWRVRFSASVAGDRDAENYFGQARGAADGEDIHDVQKPPTGPSNAYVRFINTDKQGRKAAYAFDMRPANTGRQKSEWTVAVGAAKGDADVTLTWDGLNNMPSRSKLVLRDSVTNKVVSMNGRSSYTYKNTEAGATRLFTVSLSTQNTAGPLQIRNVQTVATSGGRAEQRGINVRFSLSQDADVQASVRTLSGKVINVLSGATRGVSQDKMVLRWNGRSREGSEVPSGPYILEITARTDEGETVTVKRPITYLQ